MKKISILLIIGLLFINIVGCQGQQQTVTEKESDSKAEVKQVKLKLAHVCSDTHPYNTAGLKLAELVRDKTRGAVDIQVYPAAQLGGERDLIEGLQAGTVDIVISSLGVAASFVPEMNIFNLPFIFNDANHYSKVTQGHIGKKVLEACNKAGLKGLGFAGPVFRVPMNNKKPVNTPDDFRGVKYRLMEVPLHIDTYKALGASPVPIPFGELYTALQLGTVDGCENAVATLYSQKFYEVQKYMSLLPVFSNGCVILMGELAWNKLTPEQQKVLLESLPETIEKLDHDYLAMTEEGLEAMKAAGLKVNTPPSITPFREAVIPVYDKYLATLPKWAKDAVTEIQNMK